MTEKHQNVFTDPETAKKIAQLENSPEMQNRLQQVKADMKTKTFNPLSVRFIVMVILVMSLLRTTYYPLLFVAIAWWVFTNPNDKNQTDLDESYVNNFLSPLLQTVFPGTTLNYLEGFDRGFYDCILPKSHRCSSSCHITFADKYKTEFTNMQSWHYERHNTKKSIKVTDFYGQVFLVRLPTKVKGRLRIVPVIGKRWGNSKAHGRYGDREKDEVEIQTESLEFNDAYSIFSTDEFYARLILDPNVITILNNWAQKMPISLYVAGEYIVLGFDSGRWLFSTPTSRKAIEDISIANEYEKVRKLLADFYDLIDIFIEKA
ncbi:DUF3137 domain-containing protein [Varibaculum vaginae]|uniref:DUF3137 domain-containing protein n=1 Tax=Varibaculum vaginae TaxID=2364797 RepID=UPI000F08B78C|nr:DUF3137 domain-containing protein [Varibaculum vaginae]